MQAYRPESMVQKAGPSETAARQLWAITSSWTLILHSFHRRMLTDRQ